VDEFITIAWYSGCVKHIQGKDGTTLCGRVYGIYRPVDPDRKDYPLCKKCAVERERALKNNG